MPDHNPEHSGAAGQAGADAPVTLATVVDCLGPGTVAVWAAPTAWAFRSARSPCTKGMKDMKGAKALKGAKRLKGMKDMKCVKGV